MSTAFLGIPHPPFDANVVEVLVGSAERVEMGGARVRGCVELVELGEKLMFFQKGREEGNIAIAGCRKRAHQTAGGGSTHL